MQALQGTRIMAAMALCCRELGAGRVSVSDVVARAGVSRRTFYELFNDRDDCLAAALEEGLRRATEQVIPAYRAQGQWREAIRAGLDALLAFIDSDRTFGRLLVIDWLAAGDTALARRAEILSVVVDAVESGRRQTRAPSSTTRSTAEGAVGGVLAILHSRLLAAPAKPVSRLAGELTATLVLPYMGAAAAGKEAGRRPARPKASSAQSGDPLAELDVRLTYRTLLVLRALADQNGRGGVSNRQVAQAAGISDQGQVSKLLARLADRGLLTNHRKGGRMTGAANAWRLTEKGALVEQATRR